MIEIWQCNAAGRYRHKNDTHGAPLDPNFSGYGRVLTDADGRFAFEGLPRGPITMVVQAAGRPPTSHAARVPTGEQYDLRV